MVTRGNPIRQVDVPLECSDLVLGLKSFELAFAEPVVVLLSGLLPSEQIEEGASTEIDLNWFMNKSVDDCFQSSTAGHV